MSPRRRSRRICVALIISLLGAACSTTFQPRRSERIGLVIRHGGAWYVEGDREVPVGPLGGDLGALVAGRPDAVRLARRSRAELAVGVPSYLAGVAAVVVGLLVRKTAGWITIGGGVAIGGTGLVLMGAGVTNAVDAINTYNDDVRDDAATALRRP